MSNIDLFNIKLKRYLIQYDYIETLLEETKILFEEYNQQFLKEYYNEEEQKQLAEKNKVKISTLGRGLSTGTELEYLDSETIKNALKNRS